MYSCAEPTRAGLGQAMRCLDLPLCGGREDGCGRPRPGGQQRLFDELDDEVEGEEGTRADQRELHGVLLGHHLHVRLARRLLRLKQCPLAANPDEQRAEDEQVEVRVYQDEVWNDEHRNDEQIRSPEASDLCFRRGDGLGDALGGHCGARLRLPPRVSTLKKKNFQHPSAGLLSSQVCPSPSPSWDTLLYFLSSQVATF